MLPRLPFSSLLTGAALFLLPVFSAAQIPDFVIVVKISGIDQTSANDQQPGEFGYGVEVLFPSAVPSSTVVQLTGMTTLRVPRIEPDQYSLEQYLGSAAALDLALPDGAYTLSVSGGGTPSSTPLTLSTGPIGTTRFTNFDALQAWPESRVRFTWAPIPGALPDDVILFSVERPDGTVVYESPELEEPGSLNGLATSIEVDGLPANEPLVAQLIYLRYNFSFANNNRTFVATGRGFALTAPIRRVQSRPAIVLQPQPQSVAAGSTVVFSVGATGGGLAYQWRRNGVPLVGATGPTLVIANSAPAHAGLYTVDVINSSGTVTSNAVALSVNTAVQPGRIANLAIRSQAGSGAKTLIVGFAIGPAEAAGSKPVLLRGIGPALAAFGVPDVLSDPKLEVFRGPTKISENDNWSGSSEVAAVGNRVGAFGLADTASKDAALYSAAFASGSYSVQLTGVGGATGVALAEIYDASTGSSTGSPRLINVSARTQVGTGADMLIAGFVISGDAAKTVLIRAIGPTLGDFGVAGALADPKLELFSGSTKLSENDNWGGSSAISNVFLNAGAFPIGPGSRDSTLLVTLPPGSYTAQISGVDNTTGIALVEIYEVP